MGTYPPKPAGIAAGMGMGKSFSLNPRSWRVWVRHLADTVLNARPAGFCRNPLLILSWIKNLLKKKQ